ncbi:hypothetical protein A5725_09880 [Mycobacterium kubicae]|uniref:hypothetical protein n=1 Tax=Mycobacterium kubicae TaxID=120959 RepID=UPI0008005A3F|nr:hypothetical protein [Mycobacterium kubicae]OBF23255.1 hypothetical protein A5725_09880 [Mycobacterium kubicae]
MVSSNAASVRDVDTSNTHGGPVGAQPTRSISRFGHETKVFYKTSEFLVFVVAAIGVLLASYLVKATDGHGDYFQPDKAWLYISILSVGYIVSRGLAKSGTRHHGDDR